MRGRVSAPLATRSAREILRFRALLPFALAHHPTCSAFREDVLVVRVGRRRALLCVGCAAFWPAVLVGVPATLLLMSAAPLAWWVPLPVATALGFAQLLSYAGWTTTRRRKVAVKLALGSGAAAALSSIALAPVPLAARAAGIALLGVAALGAQMLRLPRLLAICDACPWRRQWDRCPGFAPINDHAPDARPAGWSGEGELPRAWPWPTAPEPPRR